MAGMGVYYEVLSGGCADRVPVCRFVVKFCGRKTEMGRGTGSYGRTDKGKVL